MAEIVELEKLEYEKFVKEFLKINEPKQTAKRMK